MKKEVIFAEAASRASYQQIDILKGAFPKQKDFIADKSRLKAIFAGRRSAKTYTAGLYLVKEAIENPNCNCLFLGLTRVSASGAIWKDILKVIDRDFNLGIKFHETNLTATLPNGSVIWVAGVDTDESEMNKLLGRKYRLCVLDEASMYSINLYQLVYNVLKQATADQRGTICMMGTSSNIARGLFYEITVGKEQGWSLWQWTAFDNPYMAVQWQEELDEIDKLRPLFKKTPMFMQGYLNQWIVDEDAKVYKYVPGFNDAPYLPRDLSDWHYILGVDIAHSPDSSAFVVGAYHEADPTLYVVYAYKQLKMDITDVAVKVKQLDAQYHFDTKVVDGANKQAVMELNNRHSLNLLNADKTGKADFINIMNAEFIQGHIKVLPGAHPIKDEYSTLVWVTDNGKVVEPKKENQSIHNDLADSCLYMWRYAYTYLWHPKTTTQVVPGSLASWEPQHLAKLQEQVRKEQNPTELDNLDPGSDLFSDDAWEDPF